MRSQETLNKETSVFKKSFNLSTAFDNLKNGFGAID